METITYYKAGPNDLQALIDLRIAFAFELSGEQTEKATQHLKDQLQLFFTKMFRDKTGIFYLAKCGEIFVGIGGMIFREHPGNFKNPSGKAGYLMNMYSIPSFRRKGICSALMTLLIEDAKNSGITAFELHATKTGEYVYKKEGFEIHDEPTYRKYI